MSMPITCLPQKQDTLFHVLYGSDVGFMQRLIEESIINISREYPAQGVLEALVFMRPCHSDTVDKLRAKFFMLLEQDGDMRKKVCNDGGKSSIVKGLCPYKAVRFFDELHGNILPAYAQDQTIPLATFVDMLRSSYLSS